MNIFHVTFNIGVGGTEQVITQLVEAGNIEQLTQEILCIDGDIGAMGQRLVALADTLTRPLEQPDRIARLGSAARKAFEARFSVATMVGHYPNLYHAVADTPR